MNESPLFVKMFDFVAWVIPLTIKFPKEQRFVVAARLQQCVFDAHEALIRASQAEEAALRGESLRLALTELALVRFYLRLSQRLAFMTIKQYEFASAALREIGLLLRAWQRKHQAGITVAPSGEEAE